MDPGQGLGLESGQRTFCGGSGSDRVDTGQCTGARVSNLKLMGLTFLDTETWCIHS